MKTYFKYMNDTCTSSFHTWMIFLASFDTWGTCTITLNNQIITIFLILAQSNYEYNVFNLLMYKESRKFTHNIALVA